MTDFHALIPCAGSGSRAGTAQPKQYQTLAGQALVMHTVQALAQVPDLTSGWLVLAPDDDFQWPSSPWPAHFQRLRCGGTSRAQSVFNGLQAMLAAGLDGRDWVLVHDAARCLVQPQAVQRLVQACSDDPVGGLLALPLADTLKSEHTARQPNQVAGDHPGGHPGEHRSKNFADLRGRVCETLPREHRWLAQTPQMFRLRDLHDALAAVADTDFAGITDESSAMERLGLSPRLVQGDAHNFKVTYPADFALAEAILRSRA